MSVQETRAETFEITRADGRSNSQVICGFVGNCEPGKVFSYQALSAALSVGTDRAYDVQSVQSAVRAAGPLLGRLHKRALQNVPLVGYRLALADEHIGLAVMRQDKASRQIKRGFELLRDTRIEEIKDDNARRAHEAQLLVIAGMCHAMMAQEKRLGRVERKVNELLSGAMRTQGA